MSVNSSQKSFSCLDDVLDLLFDEEVVRVDVLLDETWGAKLAMRPRGTLNVRDGAMTHP
jgi:hypothetical protein